MNTDFSKLPREEVEARITTMLLDEMDADEATELRAFLANDPEFLRLLADLEKTISLVAEARDSKSMQLSDERHEKVLATFKVIKPVELKARKRFDFRMAASIAAIIAFPLVIAALMFRREEEVQVAFERINALIPANAPDVERQSASRPNGPDSVQYKAHPGPPNVHFYSDEPGQRKDLPGPTSAGLSDNARPPQQQSALNLRLERPGLSGGIGGVAAPSQQDLAPLTGLSETITGKDMVESRDMLGREFQVTAKSSPEDDVAKTEPPVRLGFAEIPSTPTALVAVPSIVATDELFVAKEAEASSGKEKNDDRIAAKFLRDLETTRKLRSAIEQRIKRESVDGAVPKGAMVDILDRAEVAPAGKPGMWERFRGAVTGEVERTARVEVTKDVADISPLMPLQNQGGYDPYFLQTEFEKIRSQKTLNEVVSKLKLNETWSNGGQKLSTNEAAQRLRRMLTVEQAPNSALLEIKVRSEKPEEAARIANTVAEVYGELRSEQRALASRRGVEALKKQVAELDELIAQTESKIPLQKENSEARPALRPVVPAPIPQPETQTSENAFSTFSLNVSDVSFKLAAASLEKGLMPEAVSIRSEEFINAFDYRDPEPSGAPVSFAWERARYPFAQGRDVVRLSVKTAAMGREAGRPMNIVLLLDSSGSMERADRVRIIQECLRVLASQLQAQDRISVVAFARTARLWVDGLPGSQAAELPQRVGALAPEGGTNLEEAMNLGYQTARKYFLPGGINRVVLLTDGAANLGDAEPESLKKKVETNRQQGIALDCFGIGWDGLNDDLLETLSRNGDGRYGFVNTPEAATTEFAPQLAGALKVAASDVKVQIEFNPRRVTAYRQVGYAKHQLTKEQFRDNKVDAAEIGAAEAGNAVYVIQVNPAGEGPLGTARVRFKTPGTNDYREHEWTLAYEGAAKAIENANPSLRLATVASAFSEWLTQSPYAAEVTTDQLLKILAPAAGADPRPKQLEGMIRQAKSISGK